MHIHTDYLELTRLEYGIIEFLSMNPSMVFDKDRIYHWVCGYDAEGDYRVITQLFRQILQKFQQFTETEYIETIWGMGYRWIK